MENLEKIIDPILREKLVSLLQENSVRIKNINIRYTSKNKKISMERMDDILKSFDRLLRGIPKELTKVEKSVRQKYQSVPSKERCQKLKSDMQDEADLLLKKMVSDFEPDFKKLGKVDYLMDHVEKATQSFRESTEKFFDKMLEALNKDLGGVQKLLPSDLCKLYEMEEWTLIDLNIIPHLQDIHMNLQEMKNHPDYAEVSGKVEEALKQTAIISKNLESKGDLFTPEMRKKKKLEVAKASLLFKELVIMIRSFLEQWKITPENRNQEFNDKVWHGIETLFKEEPESANILPKLKTYHDILSSAHS